MKELNLDCLNSLKAKELEKINGDVVNGEGMLDDQDIIDENHPIVIKQIRLAVELIEELKANNKDFIFDTEYGDLGDICFVTAPANISEDYKYLFWQHQAKMLSIGIDGYYDYDEFVEMMEFYNSKRD